MRLHSEPLGRRDLGAPPQPAIGEADAAPPPGSCSMSEHFPPMHPNTEEPHKESLAHW